MRRMTWPSYRRVWWATLLPTTVPATVLGLIESPIPALVIALAVAFICLGSAMARADRTRQLWAEVFMGAVLVVGGAPVLGWYAGPLLLLASATSVPVVRALLRLPEVDDRVTVRDGSTEVDGAASCWSVMSGAELCEMWGRSFSSVRSGRDVSRRAVAAAIRGSVLDELERRDGAHFADWLRRHPSPARGPSWAAAPPPGPPA